MNLFCSSYPSLAGWILWLVTLEDWLCTFQATGVVEAVEQLFGHSGFQDKPQFLSFLSGIGGFHLQSLGENCPRILA